MTRGAKLKKILYHLFSPFKIRKQRKKPVNPTKILVIRQDNRIGNLILITPFLEKCADCFPSAKIDVVVGGFFGDVIRNNPRINKLLIYDQLKFIRYPWLFLIFIAKLRKTGYNIVFDMKSALSFNNMMLTLLAGAAYRVGFSNEISHYYYDISKTVDTSIYEAENLTKLLDSWSDARTLPPILYVPKEESITQAAKTLQKLALPIGKIIGIHTGGRGSKRIPLDDFMALGKRLQQKQLPVLFFFGPDETTDMLSFKEAGFICINPKKVEEFGGYLPHLALFISCDTGPMHMAAGAGISTYSIFVNSSPNRYAPRGEKFKVVQSIAEIEF